GAGDVLERELAAADGPGHRAEGLDVGVAHAGVVRRGDALGLHQLLQLAVVVVLAVALVDRGDLHEGLRVRRHPGERLGALGQALRRAAVHPVGHRRELHGVVAGHRRLEEVAVAHGAEPGVRHGAVLLHVAVLLAVAVGRAVDVALELPRVGRHRHAAPGALRRPAGPTHRAGPVAAAVAAAVAATADGALRSPVAAGGDRVPGAGVASRPGVASVARRARVGGVTSVTSVPGIARVTRVASIAGVTRVASIARRALGPAAGRRRAAAQRLHQLAEDLNELIQRLGDPLQAAARASTAEGRLATGDRRL